MSSSSTTGGARTPAPAAPSPRKSQPTQFPLDDVRAVALPSHESVVRLTSQEALDLILEFRRTYAKEFAGTTLADVFRFGELRAREAGCVDEVERVLRKYGLTVDWLHVAFPRPPARAPAVGERGAAPAAVAAVATAVEAAHAEALATLASVPPRSPVKPIAESNDVGGASFPRPIAKPTAELSNGGAFSRTAAADSGVKRARREAETDDDDESAAPAPKSKLDAAKSAHRADDDENAAPAPKAKAKNGRLVYPEANLRFAKVEVLPNKLDPIQVHAVGSDLAANGGELKQLMVLVDPRPVLSLVRDLVELNADVPKAASSIFSAVLELPPTPFETVILATEHTRVGGMGLCGLCTRELSALVDEEGLPETLHPVLDAEGIMFLMSGKVEGHGYHATCVAVLRRVGHKSCPCLAGFGRQVKPECRDRSRRAREDESAVKA